MTNFPGHGATAAPISLSGVGQLALDSLCARIREFGESTPIFLDHGHRVGDTVSIRELSVSRNLLINQSITARRTPVVLRHHLFRTFEVDVPILGGIDGFYRMYIEPAIFALAADLNSVWGLGAKMVTAPLSIGSLSGASIARNESLCLRVATDFDIVRGRHLFDISILCGFAHEPLWNFQPDVEEKRAALTAELAKVKALIAARKASAQAVKECRICGWEHPVGQCPHSVAARGFMSPEFACRILS